MVTYFSPLPIYPVLATHALVSNSVVEVNIGDGSLCCRWEIITARGILNGTC